MGENPHEYCAGTWLESVSVLIRVTRGQILYEPGHDRQVPNPQRLEIVDQVVRLAVLANGRVRVDGSATTGVDFKVQMVGGRLASLPYVADDLASRHGAAAALP